MSADTSIAAAIDEHAAVVEALKPLIPGIQTMSELAAQTIRTGNKIFFLGNGGSAADAQHFAAELVGRFNRHRKALPAIALTTDTSILTAVANDYGYERVFTRQLEALSNEGDLLIAISTSGNSPNVLHALEYARISKLHTTGLTGNNGGRMKELCDVCLVVPSDNTARIQEMHQLIGHILCSFLEKHVCGV